ncbi:MAG: DUF3090 family protein [bacterium]|nr:DUF3090 family protein [bacterium]
MSDSFELTNPEHFTVGTVGPPGQRVFYLQAGVSGLLVSLKMEKQQVAALAAYLASALQETTEDINSIVPEADIGLIEPEEVQFTVGDIGIGYDRKTDRLHLFIAEMQDKDDPTDPASARLFLTRNQVASFISRAQQVVSSGRPPCRYCGAPLNGDGSWCACYN